MSAAADLIKLAIYGIIIVAFLGVGIAIIVVGIKYFQKIMLKKGTTPGTNKQIPEQKNNEGPERI